MQNEKYTNELIHETSPYLLQHAHNPVNWQPWGEKALNQAKSENKLLLISIGYSACHWCHVMAHESFEDEAIARRMNEGFVCIKVDREERPDLDQIYQLAHQLIAGRGGGWPLTVGLTPDRQPFFAGTYFPRQTRAGRIGMLEMIPRLREIWDTKKEEVLASAASIVAGLTRLAVSSAGVPLTAEVLHRAHAALAARFDTEHGGFGRAPKFPTPHTLIFLLRYARRTGNDNAARMAEQTLRAMADGGIHDQLAGGFHRYATDEKWLVPHFEKMLYDQALLALAYIEAAWVDKHRANETWMFYQQTAQRIFSYVDERLTDPNGGFYTAEDADSEGGEGRYYVWTVTELSQVLGSQNEMQFAATVFGLKQQGNFPDEAAAEQTGANILHMPKSRKELAAGLGLTPAAFDLHLAAIRAKMLTARHNRIPPHRDDKILTDWNGLMIGALAKAARICDEPRYLAAAGRAARFIMDNLLSPEGRLLHRFRAGEAAIPGLLDDYVFFIWGLLELYDASFDAGYLLTASRLNQVVLARFQDKENGGFFQTPDDGESLPVRQKEIYDGALPSGNSVAYVNLLRLSRMTGDATLEKTAVRLEQAFANMIRETPDAYSWFLCGLDFSLAAAVDVVVVGVRGAADTEKMLAALRGLNRPGLVVLFKDIRDTNQLLAELAPFTAAYDQVAGIATAYVCRNRVCELPTTDYPEMLRLLD